MSCCTSAQDKTCPTRMSDGRAFTDYRPKCMTSAGYMDNLRDNKMVASSYESRIYLQRNAETLMDKYRKDAVDKLLCGNCPRPLSDIGTMQPEQYVVRCDSVSCQRKEVNPQGLGDGRYYEIQ